MCPSRKQCGSTRSSLTPSGRRPRQRVTLAGHFSGSGVDLRDGYIHFSTAEQVRETAAKHFAAREGLLLVAVDSAQLGPQLVWEPSRGGALFPHLYASLSLQAVSWTAALEVGPRGLHVFPPDFPLSQ
ncbi:MAG: DUF952 domain-containing protein [Deltaproteobacteria bacterium]|nr:DUF952 domain-containing protein [Deltaproteobacteria bacterium]